ncbi:MAG: FHA domain-containing protein [Pseudomonadota bacterium]
MSTHPEIGVADTILLGRDSACHWRISGTTVSRNHCKILINREGIYILDLGSKNGTFVGDKKLTPNVSERLARETVVRLGENIRFSFMQLVDKIYEIHLVSPLANVHVVRVGSNDSNDVIIPSCPQESISLVIIGGHCLANRPSDGGRLTYCVDPNNERERYALGRENNIEIHNVLLAEISKKIVAGKKDKISLVAHLLEEGAHYLGRDFTSDIRLVDHLVSRRHAVLTVDNRNINIDDLQSRNGTYVNGNRIKGRTEITDNDLLKIGSVSLSIVGGKYLVGNKSQINTSKSEARVFVDHVSYVVQANNKGSKQLLFDVCLAINSGELIGIMGQSGSGKTTLLRIITGIYKPTVGRVALLNADAQHNSKGKIANGALGFVPCDDIIHSDLTVYEALYYNYLIRTNGYSKEQIDDEISALINKLKMADEKTGTNIAKQLIGDAERGGISTGQKKRVQLAMELIGMPSVLLVDEPTSGLSSEDAVIVMDILKGMAVNGSSIICTLHQPNLELFKKFDKIAFMHKGKLVYFGSAFPDALKFFNFDLAESEYISSPDSALSGLVRNEARGVDFGAQFEASPYYNDLCRDEVVDENINNVEKDKNPSNFMAQLLTLLRRNTKLKIRDKVNTIMLVAQAPIIALLISSVFYFGQSPHLVPLFLMVVASLWFGTTNAVREIVGETTILRYEMRNGLSASAYVLSKFLILSALCAFQCICMVLLVNYFLALSVNKFYLCGILYLASLTGLGLGLLISATSKNQQRAISIIPLVLIPMVVLGGGMINVSKMDKWSVATASIMPSRWAYELVVHIVDDEMRASAGAKAQTLVPVMFGKNSFDFNIILCILSMMTILAVLGVMFTVKSRSSKAMT